MSAAFDAYDWWRRRLAGEAVPYVDGTHPLGFYRFNDRGVWYPLAVWQRNGETWWHRGPDLVHEPANAELTRLMSFAHRHPVPDKAYRHWCKASAWPDDLPPVAASNLASDDDDPFAKLTRELEGEKLEIERFLKDAIETQEQADKATHWAQRLASMETDREKLFKVEKAPALKLSKEIDNKWNEPKQQIRDLRDKLRDAQGPFLLAQRKKAEAEAAQRKEAEKAVFLAGQPAKAEPESTRPAGTSGARGRKTRVVDVITGKVLNMDKAILALKTHPEMVEFVQTLVNRAYAKGLELDGCEKVVTPTTVGG